jgi:hypothetical protein
MSKGVFAMTGILEQLISRVDALEVRLNASSAAAAPVVQQAATPVVQQVAAQGGVTAEMIMGLVNPLVEVPAAQSELKGVVTGMGFSDLAQVPEASYGAVYAQFKAIYDRYFPANTNGASPALGGLGGLGAANTATTAPAII